MLIENAIQTKLTTEFAPIALYIENESHRHSSGRGAESHFKITLVSEKFVQQRAVARHRAVYACLSQELEQGVHALALHLYSPQEWQEGGQEIPASTNCLGLGS